MLSKRTLTMHNENKHLKDVIPIMDRHLFDKEERYFRTSSKETLKLWEDRAKKVLKTIHERDKNQPMILNAATTNTEIHEGNKDHHRGKYLDPIEANLQRLGNYIANAKRLRRKRPLSNADASWNKRLKLTHRVQSMKKRKPKRRYIRRKKTRLNESIEGQCTIPVILPQCILPVNNNCSERS